VTDEVDWPDPVDVTAFDHGPDPVDEVRRAVVRHEVVAAAHRRHAADGDPQCPMCVFTADGFKTDNCGTCHAPIVWAVTVDSGRMPVDAEIVPDGNVSLHKVTHESGAGAVLARVHGQAALFDDGPRRVSHFVTCPDADAWRTRRTGSR
jgi:hypothetical protein